MTGIWEDERNLFYYSSRNYGGGGANYDQLLIFNILCKHLPRDKKNKHRDQYDFLET